MSILPSIDATTLEQSASRGWPAVETEPLGPWLLRASGGFTRRANSVLAPGDPNALDTLGVPLDEALTRVTQWYAARSLPAYVQLVQGTPLDLELARRGWIAEAPVHVQVTELDALAHALDDNHGATADAVTLSDAPDAPWLARYHKACNLHANALHVLSRGPALCFASLRGDDPARAKAIGRCVIVDGWAGFSAIEVDPEHRRRGLATTIMRALTRWASRSGAARAYLQVETDNDAAIALYARMGFTTHHDYHYRRFTSS